MYHICLAIKYLLNLCSAMVVTYYLPALGKSADSAFALSSGVGIRMDHPFCSVACAAYCTVLTTPTLLASVTT